MNQIVHTRTGVLPAIPKHMRGFQRRYAQTELNKPLNSVADSQATGTTSRGGGKIYAAPTPSKTPQTNYTQSWSQLVAESGDCSVSTTKLPIVEMKAQSSNRAFASSTSRAERAKTAVPQAQSYSVRLPGNQSTYGDSVDRIGRMRASDMKYRPDEYYPGLIISTVQHCQDSKTHGMNAIGVENYTPSKFGPIYSKCRKLIVIQKHADHFLAIPIFTHNGKGLDGKKHKNEYVSIRDRSTTNPTPPESRHANLFATRKQYFRSHMDGFHVFSERSVAYFTHICSHSYAEKVTFEGDLEAESLQRLLGLVESCWPRPG